MPIVKISFFHFIKVFSTIAVEFSTYIAGKILFVSVVRHAKEILQLLTFIYLKIKNLKFTFFYFYF